MTRSPETAPSGALVSGLVERITFHSPESGFCVLRVVHRQERITIVGHVPAIAVGEHVQAAGEWVVDRAHGRQFKASWLRTAPPLERHGIERYLASGLIKGIGKQYAKRLVDAFGEDVFEIIERTPARLRDVAGIGPARATRIAESWAEQRAVRDIMVFLHAHGVGTARASRIFRTYGVHAIGRITENPYCLARDIRGIGFTSADKVATSLGLAADAPARVEAGVEHVLTQAVDEGHCGVPWPMFLERATTLLAVEARLVERAAAAAIAAGRIVDDAVDGGRALFLRELYEGERHVAQLVSGLCQGAPPWGTIDAERARPWVEQRLGMTLGTAQTRAFGQALQSRLLVITGGPGVGKTTLLNAILTVLRAKGVRAKLCAPTGRAAKRLQETTGLEAKTIHRLLEVNPRDGTFKRHEGHPLEADLIVVDETSMVDVLLMQALLRAVAPTSALLLVGDADQLPSVGPGRVLADVIGSGAVPVVHLDEVFRQAGESAIVAAAHQINRGEMPELTGQREFIFIPANEPAEIAERVVDLVARRIPGRTTHSSARDIQVLTPMNRGECGARALNAALQRALNPTPPSAVERFGWRFGLGDRVMQTENDYDREVYNGDLGHITAVDADAGELTVTFDGRPVVYDAEDLDRLAPAFAMTIHKSQGSEFPVVVIPLATQHYPMLQRPLVYTAITRARALVVVVGQPKALALAVRATAGRTRQTKLREWLAGSFGIRRPPGVIT